MISEILAEYSWLGPLAWQSTLCLAAGLGGSFLLWRSAARAHQVLLLSLVAAVAIPALRQVVKQNQWGLLVAERAVATSEPRPVPAAIDWVIPDRPVATEATNVALPAQEPEPVPVPTLAKPRFEWTHAILPVWLSISTILLLRLAAQFLLGRRLAKRSEVVEDSLLLQMIEHAKGKLGVRVGVEVRRSGHAHSPVIWCWGRRSTLLIPGGPCLGDNRLDWPSILCHELAHTRRRDHVSGLFAELMVCILPWQPLLWWARHRLAALSEEACDDWVIASGQRASGYARTLLSLTAQSQAAFIPGVVTSRRSLAGRIRRILADGCGNPRAGVRWSLAAVALASGLAVGVGFAQTCSAPLSPADAKPPTAAREQLDKVLDAMLYHDRAVLPIALRVESELYNLDAPAEAQHVQALVMEQRADGKRLDATVSVRSLRNGQLREVQVSRSVFNGKQFLYRQQSGGDSSPLTAVLQRKDEGSRIRAFYFMWGSTLFGYLPGDERPVAALLKSANEVVFQERREEVDGFACRVIEGKTDHGMYKLWIDPEHDFRIRRALIDKGPDDLYYGKPVSAPRPEGLQDRTATSVHLEISEVRLEKIDGRFIATAESATTTTRTVAGKENHSKIVVKRSQIDLKPDFEKLGAFIMDGIPEGTILSSSDPNDHTYAYEWHNGKAVSVAPDGGTLVGRIQFSGHADLGNILIGKRRFHARFTPEGRGERDSHGVELTLEQNGAFQVKDVPPGKYRLKLELTDLMVEKTPSGGLMPLVKRIAEAEREFAIPEGKEAAQKAVDLGVIEMVISSTNTGKEPDTTRGQAQ